MSVTTVNVQTETMGVSIVELSNLKALLELRHEGALLCRLAVENHVFKQRIELTVEVNRDKVDKSVVLGIEDPTPKGNADG